MTDAEQVGPAVIFGVVVVVCLAAVGLAVTSAALSRGALRLIRWASGVQLDWSDVVAFAGMALIVAALLYGFVASGPFRVLFGGGMGLFFLALLTEDI